MSDERFNSPMGAMQAYYGATDAERLAWGHVRMERKTQAYFWAFHFENGKCFYAGHNVSLPEAEEKAIAKCGDGDFLAFQIFEE